MPPASVFRRIDNEKNEFRKNRRAVARFSITLSGDAREMLHDPKVRAAYLGEAAA